MPAPSSSPSVFLFQPPPAQKSRRQIPFPSARPLAHLRPLLLSIRASLLRRRCLQARGGLTLPAPPPASAAPNPAAPSLVPAAPWSPASPAEGESFVAEVAAPLLAALGSLEPQLVRAPGVREWIRKRGLFFPFSFSFLNIISPPHTHINHKRTHARSHSNLDLGPGRRLVAHVAGQGRRPLGIGVGHRCGRRGPVAGARGSGANSKRSEFGPSLRGGGGGCAPRAGLPAPLLRPRSRSLFVGHRPRS